MKKILGLTIAALLVMALVGGGTWAYFSDPEQSLGNTITAGILDLTPDWDGSAVITFTDVVPGGTNVNVFATILTNAGDMDGYLQIDFANPTNGENGLMEPEIDDGDTVSADDSSTALYGELAANMTVTIYLDIVDDNVYVALDDTLVYEGLVSGISGVQLDDEPMVEAATFDFRIDYTVDSAVNNVIMSDIAGFDILMALTQQID